MLFTLIDLGLNLLVRLFVGVNVDIAGVEDGVYGGGYVSGDVEADVVVGAMV